MTRRRVLVSRQNESTGREGGGEREIEKGGGRGGEKERFISSRIKLAGDGERRDV